MSCNSTNVETDDTDTHLCVHQAHVLSIITTYAYAYDMLRKQRAIHIHIHMHMYTYSSTWQRKDQKVGSNSNVHFEWISDKSFVSKWTLNNR